MKQREKIPIYSNNKNENQFPPIPKFRLPKAIYSSLTTTFVAGGKSAYSNEPNLHYKDMNSSMRAPLTKKKFNARTLTVRSNSLYL